MELKLPAPIANKRDLIKLLREVENQIEERTQSRISQEQTGSLRSIANPTRSLTTTLELNDMELNDENLAKLKDILRALKDQAPQVRISFSSEPDQKIAEDMVAWFRREISPIVLVQIGVQPTIAGGAIVRTPMRRMDFSLRKQLLASSDKLSGVLRSVS